MLCYIHVKETPIFSTWHVQCMYIYYIFYSHFTTFIYLLIAYYCLEQRELMKEIDSYLKLGKLSLFAFSFAEILF